MTTNVLRFVIYITLLFLVSFVLLDVPVVRNFLDKKSLIIEYDLIHSDQLLDKLKEGYDPRLMYELLSRHDDKPIIVELREAAGSVDFDQSAQANYILFRIRDNAPARLRSLLTSLSNETDPYATIYKIFRFHFNNDDRNYVSIIKDFEIATDHQYDETLFITLQNIEQNSLSHEMNIMQPKIM
jgi:hypothetical protein